VSSHESTDDAAPPRAARGLVWRGLLAGALIALSTAGAVYASVKLLIDDVVPPGLEHIPELARPEGGAPQTVLLLGSDRRVGDTVPPRSDTIMLVRLDPDAPATTVTSIPRDLLVDGRRINAAYQDHGARGTVRAVTRLLSTRDRPFPIHHVITADFTGFREVIDAVGCVYVDVDRRYFNEHGGVGGYAVIDIDPGYQRLCGKDALAYVRYRHDDNDLVRGARQQEFLRQLRRQDGVEALMGDDLGDLRRVARLARRSLHVDRGIRDRRQLFRFAELASYSGIKPVRNLPFPVRPAPGDPNSLVATPAMRRRVVDAFLGAAGAPPAPARRRTSPGRRDAPALVDARRDGEDRAIVAARRIDFPFHFPARRTKGAEYVGETARTYTIRDGEGREHDAYRLVFATDRVGEFYGVQGTTWRDPPILEERYETEPRGGRRLMVFRDGGRVRLVAWRTRGAVYWVSNTLTRSLGAAEMTGIAASLTRFGR
jgi:polyisoprenyl-teichoic acid--peptidoglycan teichoic acid transferase